MSDAWKETRSWLWHALKVIVVISLIAGVIVVTLDHRALDMIDTIYEMEDGLVRQQTISEQCTPHSEQSIGENK